MKKHVIILIVIPLFFILFSGINFPGFRRLAKKDSSLQLTFNYSSTTPLLHPPYVSGVINDPTDPVATIGIVVDIKENNKNISANEYSLEAASDNDQVVSSGKIIITKEDGAANIKIIPSQSGYCNITITLHKNKNTTDLVIYYAASPPANVQAGKFWHTSASDASAAIALDSDYMLIGDDEINALFVYHRYQSGLPVAIFNYEELLHLPDDKEVDCEAGVRSLKNPQKTYWTGSMTNGGKNFKEQLNRNFLFQTDITGTGSSTTFNYKGCYNNLRHFLIKWGDHHGYNFTKAAGFGMTSKSVEGFNVEGITFAPDSTTLYVGFRAPIVPLANRSNALIAPIKNFEEWFNNGHPKGEPVIGDPVEINLGGRGIRDFIHLKNGSYVIITGSSDEVLNAALYTWTGNVNDEPVMANTSDVRSLKIESGLEIDNNNTFTGKIQVISDNGTSIYYSDNTSAKYLNPYFKKFQSDIVSLH